jgi:prepilin-type N-terminal cleavage/methylation domain-containing protein
MKKKGFTIVEMLIVLAIVALLVSFVMGLTDDSKKRSRDSRREEDIKEIQNALGLYVVDNHKYPVCGRQVIKRDGTDCLSQALITSNYISSSPTDPLGKDIGDCGAADSHVYCYTSDGFGYTLEYALETNEIQGKAAGWQSVVVSD